jgi:sugar (pentulose or hexulose) kinase
MSKRLKPSGRQVLIGVDIGTLSTKGVLVRHDGHLLAETSVEYEIIQRRSGWAEHDPVGHWWKSTVAVICNLLEKSRVRTSQVAAIGISGLFPSLCLLGTEDEPLSPAMLYSDMRGGQWLESARALTNTKLNGDEAILKLLWLGTYQPELLKRARRICSTQGYLVYRLTGRNTVDYKTAVGYGGLLDRRANTWSSSLCREIGISPELMPEVMAASAVAGCVTPEAAQLTGLAVGTPVLVGVPDTYASLLGYGVFKKGDALVSYGTTGYMAICKYDLVTMLSNPAVADVESPWFLGAYLVAIGSSLQWFREQFGGRAENGVQRVSYQVLESLAEMVSAGSDGLMILPYFQGQRTPIADPYAKAVVFGLTLSHTRAHFYRALLESFGYALLHGMRGLSAELAPCRLVAGGGGARSHIWRQIVTDVLGLPQEYIPSPGAPLGSAFLAGYGIGLFGDFDVLTHDWLVGGQFSIPNAETHQVYAALFPVYADLSERLWPTQKVLHNILREGEAAGMA